VVEASLIPALVAAGAGHGTAVLGVLAWRALTFLLPIPVGAASYVALQGRPRTPNAVPGRKHCDRTIRTPPALPTVDGVDTTAPERNTTTPDDAPRLRASDEERNATIGVLQDAMSRGLLTPEEGDQRMAAVFAARFRDELPPLTADLPSARTAPETTTAPGGWRALLTALFTLVRAEITATRAAGIRSRRFLVLALVVLAWAGGLALVVGHGFWDGGHEHFLEHGRP
jgi:hypothetical protein